MQKLSATDVVVASSAVVGATWYCCYNFIFSLILIVFPCTRLLSEMSLLVPALEDSVKQLIMRLESAYGTAATTQSDSNVRSHAYSKSRPVQR